MPEPATLRIAIGDYPHTLPLKRGEIVSPWLTLDFVEVKPMYKAFLPMVREHAYDASEMALATAIQAKAYGKGLTLLPAAMLARFQHGTVLYNSARGTLTPADLSQFHLVVSPPTAQLHSTVTQWFARAGTVPRRVSTCNSLSATIQTIIHGTAIGLVPVRVMQEESEARRVKRVRVTPELPAHHVSICYQVSEFGPGLRVLVALTRELVAQHKLFV